MSADLAFTMAPGKEQLAADLAFPMAPSKEQLAAEVAYLHQSIFRRAPSDQLTDSYREAHLEIDEFKHLDEMQILSVEKIIARRLDAVSIEPWLRLAKQRHALSVKLLLIMYLSESDALHSEFFREETGLARGYGRLVLAGLSGMGRLARGYAQKAIHGIV